MQETVYTYVGHAYGNFTARDTGELLNYCNVYVISPFTGEQSRDRHFQGFQAEKLKCESPSVLEGLNPNDKVVLYFDKRGRVIGVKPVK